MSIFYFEEHLGCANYMTDVKLGFKYVEVKAGKPFITDNKGAKHLYFFLSGRVKIRYNEFPEMEFGTGEMIFLPKSADSQGEVLSDTTFIVLTYDIPTRLCDKVELNDIIEYAKGIEYTFDSLPIVPVLMDYLELLRIYLQEGVNCYHLHEMKQKELFIVIRAFYKKEDIARFFAPSLGKSMAFHDKVMENYMKVKTVKEMSSICGYSERRFLDLFVTEFGEAPYQWMQKQKAKHIIGKLSQPNASIKEIIDEFSFSSASHFTKYCLRQYGKTPSQMIAGLSVENQ